MGYSLPQILHRRSEEVGDVSAPTLRSGNASPLVVIPSDARDLGSSPSQRKPRFLVASRLGMTRRWVGARHHPLSSRLSCYSSLATYHKKVKILTLRSSTIITVAGDCYHRRNRPESLKYTVTKFPPVCNAPQQKRTF